MNLIRRARLGFRAPIVYRTFGPVALRTLGSTQPRANTQLPFLRKGLGLLAALLVLSALPGCGKDEPKPAPGLGSIRWTSFPVSLRADSSLQDGGAKEEDLLAAVAFWENKAGKKLFTLGTWPHGRAPFTGRVTDPDTLTDNVIFFQNPWPNSGEWPENVAGKTILHSTGGFINHAVVFLNGETPLCPGLCIQEGEQDQTSRRRLIAHELGHFLGFVHVSDPKNIMNPEIVPGGSLENEIVDQDLLVQLTQ